MRFFKISDISELANISALNAISLGHCNSIYLVIGDFIYKFSKVSVGLDYDVLKKQSGELFNLHTKFVLKLDNVFQLWVCSEKQEITKL